MGSRLLALEAYAALELAQVGVFTLRHKMNMFTIVFALVSVSLTLSLPLATQKDIESSIAAVRDLEETDFAAEPRDAKAFVESAIEEVRDLEEPEFSARERDAKELVGTFIAENRDL